MKECTFQPIVVSNPNVDTENKQQEVVSGMEVYLENRDHISKLKADKKNREREVFDFVKKYDESDHLGHTVPEPFQLSKVIDFCYIIKVSCKIQKERLCW